MTTVNWAETAPSGRLPIINPASGAELGSVALASVEAVDAAVAAAKAAFPAWSGLGLQQRVNLIFDLRQAIVGASDELVDIVLAETGKTLTDARAELTRSIEAVGLAVNASTLFAGPYTRGVSGGVNAYEVRYPVGIVAAISPFNFPLIIPLVQTMMAIACGNTVVVKPSERNPSALLRVSEMFRKAGLPEGVFNVLTGDRTAVDRIIDHPDIAAITFVGSTPVAEQVRKRGVANGKRVQAFGGGKNHMVVMPDCDLATAADAAVSAAFGAAGQRCMAISVVVAVGDVGDRLVDEICKRAAVIRMGDIDSAEAELGPVITRESRDRINRYIANAGGDGATLRLDGRDHRAGDTGWFVGPTVIDHVRPGMPIHSDEVFGPVLSVVRVGTLDEAIEVISGHDLGNGAAIFTRDGDAANRFTDLVPAGQIGINVPIPAPVFFHGFGGWKDSSFTETKLHGRDTIHFLTKTKTVTARWLEQPAQGPQFSFPTHN